jgi:hypothetical protein
VTIRVRLAAAFTLLVAAILVLVGVVTYQLLRQSLLAEIERDVARRAAMFAATARPASNPTFHRGSRIVALFTRSRPPAGGDPR